MQTLGTKVIDLVKRNPMAFFLFFYIFLGFFKVQSIEIGRDKKFCRKTLRKKKIIAIGSFSHGWPWELCSGRNPARGGHGGEGKVEEEREGIESNL